MSERSVGTNTRKKLINNLGIELFSHELVNKTNKANIKNRFLVIVFMYWAKINNCTEM